MKAKKQREEFRKQEIIDRFSNLGFHWQEFHECYNYIRYGGKPTIDEICMNAEFDVFIKKYTKYNLLIENFKHSDGQYHYCLSFDKENELKQQVFEIYFSENKNNIHKILKEIPWCLKNKIDELYDSIIKN